MEFIIKYYQIYMFIAMSTNTQKGKKKIEFASYFFDYFIFNNRRFFEFVLFPQNYLFHLYKHRH